VFGVKADLATYGKVIGGGMPIGAIAGSAAYMDALDGGTWRYGDDSIPDKGVTFFAGTFVRHPVAMAACVAVLKYLKEQGPGLQESLNAKTARFTSRLNEIFRKAGVPTHVQHFGSVMYYKFPAEERFASLFFAHLRERGVHILEGFPCFMTTAHSEEDLELVLRAYEESVAAMQEGGFFAPTSAGLDATAGAGAEPVVVPLTEAQREVWLATRMGDDASCAFNESGTTRSARRSPPRATCCASPRGSRSTCPSPTSRPRLPPNAIGPSRSSSTARASCPSISWRAPPCGSGSSRWARTITSSS
jgi:hypothetical protein